MITIQVTQAELTTITMALVSRMMECGDKLHAHHDDAVKREYYRDEHRDAHTLFNRLIAIRTSDCVERSGAV